MNFRELEIDTNYRLSVSSIASSKYLADQGTLIDSGKQFFLMWNVRPNVAVACIRC
jgi:hypothetical protein